MFSRQRHRGSGRLLVFVASSSLIASVASVVVSPAAHATADYDVVPFDPTAFSSTIPTDTRSTRIRTILTNTNKYALGTWWNTVKNYDAQTGTYLDFGGTGETHIRPSASEAYALAVALQTGAFDATATGVSTTSATAVAVKLVRSLAYRHAINTSGGWGDSWQSALWASLAGTAGYLLWADLSATDREYVRRMVEHEADRMIGLAVPYWKSRTGAPVRPCGDTAAEENAWNSRILSLATAMMPSHRKRAGWAYKGFELTIGAFAPPAAVSSATLVRGRPEGDWLEGSNVNADGTLVNHDRYHPDYVTAITESVAGSLVAALAGQPIAANALRNVPLAFDSVVDKSWVPAPASGTPCSVSPAYVAPGAGNPTGTSYIDSSSSIYYPQGNDWGNYRRMHFATFDVLVDAFGLDSMVAEKADYWEALHATEALTAQQRTLSGGAPSDGSTYRSAGEDVYPGREEAVALQAGQAWLAKWLDHQGALTTTDSTSSIIVDNGDVGFSTSGTWSVGTYNDTVNANVFGKTCRFAVAGTGANWVRFTPRISQARSYTVYAWWEDASNYASNAPFTIQHAGGTTTVTRDQRSSGGTWVSLGTYSLNSTSYVQLSDSANGYVIADAVMFTPS